MNEVYESIAKGFLISAQLPLDAKGLFVDLETLKSLGFQNQLAFTYYEYMKVLCQENGKYYVWQEVASDSTLGIIPFNFQYPNDVITNGIDYSNRYFNFVIENEAQSSASVGMPFLIMKDWPTNKQPYLEENDCVWGHFNSTTLMLARYKGGSIIDINNWAVIQSSNPKLYS